MVKRTKKKSIPEVKIESMEVDTDSFPKLGTEASETQGAQASDVPDAGSAPATPAPRASAASLSGIAGVIGRNRELMAAGVAGLIAIVALGVAWSERRDVAAMRTVIAEQQEDRRALAGGVALLQLVARVRAGGSFREEFTLAADLLADDPVSLGHLTALAPIATQGMPPLDLLQASFRQAVVPSARRTGVAALFSSVAGMFERALPGGVGTAVARPDMDEAMAGLEGLHKAERAVQAGDLEVAVVAIRPYVDTTPQVGQWLAVAEQRLNAQRAVAALDALALEKLGRFR